jgi:hypothetical protein
MKRTLIILLTMSVCFTYARSAWAGSKGIGSLNIRFDLLFSLVNHYIFSI